MKLNYITFPQDKSNFDFEVQDHLTLTREQQHLKSHWGIFPSTFFISFLFTNTSKNRKVSVATSDRNSELQILSQCIHSTNVVKDNQLQAVPPSSGDVGTINLNQMSKYQEKLCCASNILMPEVEL